MLKESPLVSTISIIGTALAISLIMVLIMLFQIKVANYSPETKRDHSLFVVSVRSEPRPGIDGYTNNGAVSYELLTNYLYQMETPELVTGFIARAFDMNLSIPTKMLYSEHKVKATDINFWKFFDFRFLEGGVYDQGEYESGLPLAIINKEVADLMFSDGKAVGNTININLRPHRIVGVVADISNVAQDAYAQVWVPITSNAAYMSSDNNGTSGDIQTCFLYRDNKNRKEIEEEFEGIIKKFSDSSLEYQVTAQTAGYVERVFGSYRNTNAIKDYFVDGFLIILFLLLLPAINLTGITMNNMRQRASEIGLRKAFGAGKATLLGQIITENLVITAIGAAIGFLLSFAFISWGRSFLLSSNTLLTVDMLLSPFSFLTAVFFCLVMNLLSAGVPAWRMSRSPIIESLTTNDH